MIGKIILSGINNTVKTADKNFMITRSNKYTPNNFTLLTELAPSENLFGKAMLWKESGAFESNWGNYKKQYLAELPQSVIQSLVNYVEDGYIVQLACYCTDYNFCHRSILYDIFESYNITVELR